MRLARAPETVASACREGRITMLAAEAILRGAPLDDTVTLRKLQEQERPEIDFWAPPDVARLFLAMVARVGLERLLDHAIATWLAMEGLPFLPTDSEDPAEYRDALLQGDLAAHGGVNQSLIVQHPSARGLDLFEEAGFQGFLELGLPRQGFVGAAPDAHVYVFSEFPGSRRLRFTLTGQTGDADLLAAPVSFFDPLDPSSYRLSARSGTANEAVEFTRSSVPSVDDDEGWLVAALGYTASAYTLSVSAELPAPGISLGGSHDDRLDVGGEIDLVTFNGNANQVVRLAGTALDANLDLFVAIVDPTPFEVLAADDDSGGGAEGTDPLIQGVRLPANGTYAIAVFSPIADVDPTLGTGDYHLALSVCTNTGANPDGDGLADACDDDDDGDGFKDAEDVAPADALACQDVEDDGCDDCSEGGFDPFADGLDSDGDASCDAGGDDDDNDGCDDAGDPAPLAPSVDDDLDFVGLDCDNCPADANPDQLDGDGDGTGDVCEVPEPGAWLQGCVALAVLSRLARPRRQRSMTGTPSTALR